MSVDSGSTQLAGDHAEKRSRTVQLQREVGDVPSRKQRLKLGGARRFQAEFEHGISSRQNPGGGNSGGAGSQVRICNIQVIAGTPVGPAKFSLERKRVESTLGGRSRGERQSGLQAAETFLPLQVYVSIYSPGEVQAIKRQRAGGNSLRHFRGLQAAKMKIKMQSSGLGFGFIL